MLTDYESRGFLTDDFRLFHLKDAHGTKPEYHYHDFCKLLLLCSGSGGYMVEGQRYNLVAGDIVFIGSHCIHRPEFETGNPYERIIIYIDPEFLRQHSTPDCDLESCFQGGTGHVLRPRERQRERIFTLAEQLEQELSGEKYGRVVLSRGMMLQLLVRVSRERRSSDASCPDPIVPEHGRILDILRYIDAHLTEDITIDFLAEEFYISKYHMMRLFRRETGRSIHSYLSERRLLHARDLIAGGMNATESCFRSGFRSYSSFTRAYAKRFGTTPTGRNPQSEDLPE